MKVANRVVYNTGVLYVQLIIGVIIGLFTTRIVLQALGTTDYGIYMLVAGIVGMLSILNSNMATTSMRFLAHSLGSASKEKMLKTFNTTLLLHFVIGGIVVIIMQIGGWLMFEYLLSIPEARVFDAKIVFQFMIITTFVTVISVPYDAVMNAHENILALSLVDTLGNVLRLGIAIYLMYSDANLLIIYGFLMLVTQVLMRVIKQWYSRVKYDECKIRMRRYVDKPMIKEILSFTGWNLFGSIGAMSVTQIKAILINMFFGVTLNAAEGISRTASSKVNMVSVSMTRALNPQLIKSEGGGNRERMLRITEIGTKFSVFLFALIAIPVLLEANYLLTIWLKDVPEYAVVFFQLLLVTMLIEKFTFQITHAIRAVGNIRRFQTTETSLLIIAIPAAYLIFKAGYGPESIYIVGIVVSWLIFFNRLYFGKIIANINIRRYLQNSVFSVFLPGLLATGISCIISQGLSEGVLRLFLSFSSFMIVFATGFYAFSLQKKERIKLNAIMSDAFKVFH